MAFDGVTIANIVYELNNTIKGGRLYKIAQPEDDEVLLTVKTANGQYRLVLSSNASLPLAYLTDDNKVSPATAPNFCMLLRKHLNNGRIVSISQPDFERIIRIEVEHLDELGDLCSRYLICEFMGKHSNIILVDDKNIILDSIKHVSAQMSSVREVLPGRQYFITNTSDKHNPLECCDYNTFASQVLSQPESCVKALCKAYTGISTVMAEEIIHRSGIDSSIPANCLANAQLLYNTFISIMDDIKMCRFTPCIAFVNGLPREFAAVGLTIYAGLEYTYSSISEVIRTYYEQKETATRIHQKSTDMRKIVTTHLERSYKKLDIQERQLKDTKKRDQYRIYGELINTYGYGAEEGSTKLHVLNYYTNEEIDIPLDGTLTATENANRYFARYNKLKRTYEAGIRLVEEIHGEIDYLESIMTALAISTTENDLANIKEELIQTGFIKRSSKTKGHMKLNNKPLHYISSDGFDIYVGKNNIQNDELTFKLATGNDWWFHAKQMPGSHVVLKQDGREVPDRAFEEAAALAAYYSKGREQGRVEIDYVLKKEVKKPAGSKPGFVVYYTNYSLVATADIAGLKLEC